MLNTVTAAVKSWSNDSQPKNPQPIIFTGVCRRVLGNLYNFFFFYIPCRYINYCSTHLLISVIHFIHRPLQGSDTQDNPFLCHYIDKLIEWLIAWWIVWYKLKAMGFSSDLTLHFCIKHSQKDLYQICRLTRCKGIQDSLGFWIPHCGLILVAKWNFKDSEFQLFVGFWIPWAVFHIPSPGFCIQRAKICRIPESGFPYMGRKKSCQASRIHLLFFCMSSNHCSSVNKRFLWLCLIKLNIQYPSVSVPWHRTDKPGGIWSFFQWFHYHATICPCTEGYF